VDIKRNQSMLAEAVAELRTAESHVLYLKQVVAGLSGLLSLAGAGTVTEIAATPSAEVTPLKVAPPVMSSEDDEAKTFPRPKDAMLKAIQSKPNLPMPPRDVIKIVKELGWYDPTLTSDKAYSTALGRLASREDIPVYVSGGGKYIYRTAPSDAAPVTLTELPDQGKLTNDLEE
jgi:hypothetical protein